MKITVYGGASPKVDKAYILKGEEFGRKLVERGHSVVYGGGARGLMGADARGTKENNGYILGIAPTFFQEVDGELYEHCDKFIFTENMRERKFLLEENGDAFVIMPGGAGTFEELFEAFTLKQLGQHDKPIVIYNINHYYDTMAKLLQECIDKGFIREANLDLYQVLTDADDILDYFENYKSNPHPKNYRGL